jgi:hypothetical protein
MWPSSCAHLRKALTAYVFTRGRTTWTEQAELSPADVSNVDFGISVAIEGDIMLVGAPGSPFQPASVGSVYVYRRTAGSWSEQTVLMPSDNSIAFFGSSVSLSGTTALVGESGNGSAADVFLRTGNTWAQEALLASNPDSDGFASSVAVSGNVALIAGPNSGIASIYVRSGASWQRSTLLDSKNRSGMNSPVALDGGTALIGVTNAADNAGAAYVFVHSAQ